MSRKQPLSQVVGVMDYYSSRRESATNSRKAPTSFGEIRQMFQNAMDTGTEVIVESSEINNMNSVRLVIDYVGDRWCKGYKEQRYYNEIIRIPHTISYAEVYASTHEVDRTKAKTKLFFRGDNPFV